MHRTRVLAATSMAALLAAGPLAGLAGAQAAPATGIGSSAVRATAIAVQLGTNGDLLTVRILEDDGTSTIDPKDGAPKSAQTLQPLTISSKAVPALNIASPAIGTTSGGAEDRKSVQPSLPSSPAFSGDLNAVLSSVVDAAGARSGLQAGLANLEVAGGLLNVPTGVVQVASAAASGKTSGSRSITIPEVRVLDLSAVLDGVGLKLTDLSIDQVLTLVKNLGLDLPGIVDPVAAVASLNSAIDTLQSTTGPLTAQVCNTVDGLLRDPIGGLTGLVSGTIENLPTTIEGVKSVLPALPTTPLQPGSPVVIPPIVPILGGTPLGGVLGLSAAALPSGFTCANLTATVTQLLDEVQSVLAKVLTASLVELGDVALLSVEDVKVGLVSDAVSTLAGTKAEVTATVGQVKVGELPVPGIAGLDLTAPAATINAATTAIQTALAGVLAPINAGLAGLVDVDLLDITEVVDAAGGYNRATSSVTAVRATLTPPALLGAALLDQKTTSTSAILGTIGSTVPAIAPLMGQLEVALGGLDALSAPAVVTIGELAGTASFRPVSARSAPGVGADPTGTSTTGTPTGTLPRTGGEAALPAILAVGLGGMALALRRLLRSATA